MLTIPLTRRLVAARPLDLRLTLGPFRTGKGDPTCLLRFDECFRATRTPQGVATVHVLVRGSEVLAEAWGDGAEWALDQLPVLIGENDDIDSFRPTNALVADLHRRTPGLRIGASHRVFEALLPAMCGQAVSGFEARRAHRQIVQAFGERAPGPHRPELLVPPDPRIMAGVDHQVIHILGADRARGDLLRRAAARAATLETIVDAPAEEAERRLRAVSGLSLWSSALVRHAALGDPDAVPVGDDRLKHLVAWAFLGERRGTDAQMLELLEPFHGHRVRVLRLLSAARLGPLPE